MGFSTPSRMLLRYWGTIPGGFPSPAQGYEDEPLDLHALLVRRPAATFFYAVKGDSLRAEGIRDGSILVVDRSLKPRPGLLVVADRDAERIVCRLPPRKPRKDWGNGVSDDGTDEEGLTVWGVVTAFVTRF